MAWRRRYRSGGKGYKPYRGRGRRLYGFMSGGYRKFRSSRRGGQIMHYLPYAVGAGLGYFAPRVIPYQDLAITALAVVPMRLPYRIKWAAQGYVAGMVIRTLLPSVAGVSASTGGANFA